MQKEEQRQREVEEVQLGRAGSTIERGEGFDHSISQYKSQYISKDSARFDVENSCVQKMLR